MCVVVIDVISVDATVTIVLFGLGDSSMLTTWLPLSQGYHLHSAHETYLDKLNAQHRSSELHRVTAHVWRERTDLVRALT